MALVELGRRLLEASRVGDVDEIHNLMASGAPFTTDWLGMSPLHFAAAGGHLQAAQMLLRAGISKDAKTKVDRTPLHVAAQFGHVDMVVLLLRNGGTVNARDLLRMTPLHWAAEKQHASAVQLLLQNGAEVDCVDKFDRTPMDIALSHAHSEIVELLQEGVAMRDAASSSSEMALATLGDLCVPCVPERATADANRDTNPGFVTIVPSTYVSQQQQPLITAAMPPTTSPQSLSQSVLSCSESIPDRSSADGSGCCESVLITLAALAEATAVRNTSVATAGSAETRTTAHKTATRLHESSLANDAETLNWFESQGIAIVSPEIGPSLVQSTLDSGQTLALTEAGKLVLRSFVKLQEAADRSSRAGCSASVDSSNAIALRTVDYDSVPVILSQEVPAVHAMNNHVR